MADLSERGRAKALRERGQIMLVAGFVLAASFIALALVLNSVIYTENLATRDTEARGSEATAYAEDAVSGGEKMIEYANRNITVGSESFSDIEDDFEKSLATMNNGTRKIQAIDGERTNITINRTIEGTRFGQFNSSDRDFTSVSTVIGGRLQNWILATGVEGTRAFRINVTDSSALLDDTETGVPFRVTLVGSGGNTWSVEIRDVDGSPETQLETKTGGTTSVTCSVGGSDPEIDVIEGTADGEQCPGYEFGDGVSEPYSIEYVAAHNITGNFSVVANTTSFTSTSYDDNTGSPFNASAIYSTRVHIVHESADIVYETDERLLPGESDEE